MNVNEAIKTACNLDSQPLSNEDLGDIIQRYDGPDLLRKMYMPIAEQDFRTKFIDEHEAYLEISIDDRSMKGKMRCCHNIHDKESGTPEKDSLFVLVHGLGGSLDQFEPLMRFLAAEKETFVALDLPGFGKSDEWDTYSMNDVVKSVRKVLDSLFEEYRNYHNVTLVGHSAGCYISIHFMLHYGDDFNYKKCLLLAPPKHTIDLLAKENRLAQFGLKIISKIPWVLDIYREQFDQCKGLKSSGISRFFYRDGDITNHYRKLWQFHNNVRIKSRSLWHYLLGWQPINWEEVTTCLSNTSIIILCGEKDVVTPLNNTEDLFKCLEDIKDKQIFTIPECGHNLTLDCPEEFLERFSQLILNKS